MVCGEETDDFEAGQDPRKLYWRHCVLFRESVSNAFPQRHANAARCSVYKRTRTPIVSSRSQFRYPLKRLVKSDAGTSEPAHAAFFIRIH
jgi:hypothetical protein